MSSQHIAASPVSNWLRRLALTLAIFSSSGQAAVFVTDWDPPYGAPFTNLGWRGTSALFVPSYCEPSGTVDVDNATACSGAAVVTSAKVELYDTTEPGQPTLETLVFNEISLIIGTLRYVAGELTQLSTTFSNLVDPISDLSGFGVTPTTEFFLDFTLDGPRLSWTDPGGFCDNSCPHGFNDARIFPPQFTITRVPEPGSVALLALGLLGLGFTRRKLIS